MSNPVQRHFKENFNRLAMDKRFHFATRLFAWGRDEFARDFLVQNGDLKIHGGDVGAIMADLRGLARAEYDYATVQNASRRRELFERYPFLVGDLLVMERVRPLLTFWGIDLRAEAREIIGDVRENSEKLLHDIEAVRELSTYAINYWFLGNRILYQTDFDLLEALRKVFAGWEVDEKNVTAYVYAFCHAVIDESNYYAWELGDEYRQFLREILDEVRKVVLRYRAALSLDVQVEFLVCEKMLGVVLDERVMDGCMGRMQELMPDSDGKDFSRAEHRGVLYIMATCERWTPHKRGDLGILVEF